MPRAAAIAMWWDIAPEARAEWEDWHTREHMPERLSIPGFLRGSRWVLESSYFVLYEAKDLATITSGPYLERLNHPTPWSLRMMPRHLNMVRSLCVVHAGLGGELPKFLATIRFAASGRPAWSGPLLESQPMPGTQTAEQKIRGGDRTAGWIGLLGGDRLEALSPQANGMATQGTVGLYCLAHSLVSGGKA
jgi:hypothetical protein